MPRQFMYVFRSYRKKSNDEANVSDSPKTLSWTRSGHVLRTGSRIANYSHIFKNRLFHNKMKIGSNWLIREKQYHNTFHNYRRKASCNNNNNCIRNKCSESKKSIFTKNGTIESLSLVTQCHLTSKTKIKEHTRESSGKDKSNSSAILSNGFSRSDNIGAKGCDLISPYSVCGVSNDNEDDNFDHHIKTWQQLKQSFLKCPYSQFHTMRSKNHRQMTSVEQCSNKTLQHPIIATSHSKTAYSQNSSLRKHNHNLDSKETTKNKLIILKSSDNKTSLMCPLNIPIIIQPSHDELGGHKISESHQNLLFPMLSNYSRPSLTLPKSTPNVTSAESRTLLTSIGSITTASDQKNWSLFKIANGSLMPLYWLAQQNNVMKPQPSSSQFVNDLNINTPYWFTKSIMSNMSTIKSTTKSIKTKNDNFSSSSPKARFKQNILTNIKSSSSSLIGTSSSTNNHQERESELQKLIRSCHEHVYDNTGVQIHRCKSCNKLFSNFSAFCDHVIASHNQAKNRCPVCHKHFSRSWLLKGHMRTHTGERPYKCHHPGCNKAFADKSNLRSHTLIHTVVGKKFVCERCQRAFAQKRYLHKHQFEVCKFVP